MLSLKNDVTIFFLHHGQVITTSATKVCNHIQNMHKLNGTNGTLWHVQLRQNVTTPHHNVRLPESIPSSSWHSRARVSNAIHSPRYSTWISLQAHENQTRLDMQFSRWETLLKIDCIRKELWMCKQNNAKRPKEHHTGTQANGGTGLILQRGTELAQGLVCEKDR